MIMVLNSVILLFCPSINSSCLPRQRRLYGATELYAPLAATSPPHQDNVKVVSHTVHKRAAVLGDDGGKARQLEGPVLLLTILHEFLIADASYLSLQDVRSLASS